VKTTESGGPRGYNAGKKVKGRKRQVMVDTDGRGLILEPQPADVQDRDGPVVLRLLSEGRPIRLALWFIHPLGRGTVLRLDQPQSSALEGSVGDTHVSQRLPLSRVRRTPRPALVTVPMIYGTDS
jgi:hypothetical protein